MTRDPDDEALHWEGDDDPTLAPGWKTVGTPVPLEGTPTEPEAEPDAATQPGSAELVMLGVLGGVYLLYSIGWLVTASRPAPVLADPVAQFMYGFGRWFVVAAPALWFGAVLWLAAGHRRARLLWLLAGAVVLVPVPFLLRG
ncbi:hypothetical protein [Agromyces bauzanensis]